MKKHLYQFTTAAVLQQQTMFYNTNPNDCANALKCVTKKSLDQSLHARMTTGLVKENS